MEKKKVLIVEDDVAMARVLELKLAEYGYQIDVAYDGKKALELIEKDGYACILLDLILPDVDGFRVLETLRQHDTQTPVVVLTNLQQDEDRKRVESLGVSGYYIKSETSLQQVAELIAEVLEKK